MDQLFMFSSEYSLDDLGNSASYNSKDDQLKETSISQNEGVDDGVENDNDYITGESLKRKRSVAATDDMNGEDDNTIFNFGLEPQVTIHERNEPVRHSLRPVSTPTSINQGSSNDSSSTYINYELAVVYICPACGAEFNAQDVWKRHLNGVHNYNTRRGLNFMPIDKLYHKCLECNKRIAMHAMENLLKHKFTHLPHRCTKCNICMRQYKYRQDLMVHLRTNHAVELIALTKNSGNGSGRFDAGRYRGGGHNYNSQPVTPVPTTPKSTTPVSTNIAIMDIKENAVDIFENTCDSIEVKNEVIEPDENEVDPGNEIRPKNNRFAIASLLEEALSCSSSSDQRQINSNEENLYEQHIQYVCRVCHTEFSEQEQWRDHIERVHYFGTVWGLGFKQILNSQTVQCMECKKVYPEDNLHTLQIHRLGHLPNKSYMRCKLCFRSFTGHKDIIKHLKKQHPLIEGNDANVDDSEDTRQFEPFGDDDRDDGNNFADSEETRSEERDCYEPQIEYLCPQCGKEFQDKKTWRRHIVTIHQLTDLNVLNFEVINDREVKCRECDKIITNAYGVQNAQQHRITHMPYKAFIRCRVCAKSYTDRKGLVKHLRSVHRMTGHLNVSQSPAIQSRQSSDIYGTPKLQSKKPRTAPVKEIVTHNNITFEIQFLEDNDETLDEAPLPELPFGRGGATRPHKCTDCGAAFETYHALRTHKQEEHEFLDFNNLQPLSEASKKQGGGQINNRQPSLDIDQSNDGEELLVPTGDEDLSYSSNSTTVSNIEQYFCYLCPACGKEFKIQNDWRRHINELHNFDKRQTLNFRQLDKYSFQCIECQYIVTSTKLKGLQDHKFRHLTYKLYIKCLLCSTCYNHKPNMLTHLRIRHNLIDTRVPSSQFEREYDDPSPIEQSAYKQNPSITLRPSSTMINFRVSDDCVSNHNAVDHDTITYYCPQCNENFVSHAFWRKHIVSQHDLNSARGLNFRQLDEHHYLCLQCYKRVTVTHTKGAIGQLQSHKFRHLPFRSFKCLACNGMFVRKQMFFKHLNRMTNRCEAEPKPNTTEQISNESFAYASQMHNYGNANVDSSSKKNDDIRRLKLNTAPDTTLSAFLILCPQCGIEFDSWRLWREHINMEHSLGRRETLNFQKIHDMLHECRECHDCVHGRKLRDLQIHKFKHMPFGDYLRCRFCESTYYYLRNMSQHLAQKHPNELAKHERTRELLQGETSRPSAIINDEDSTFVADEENDDNEGDGNGNDYSADVDDEENVENEEEDDAANDDSDNAAEQEDNDDEMVIPECVVEEVEPIEEAEEQFVLG